MSQVVENDACEGDDDDDVIVYTVWEMYDVRLEEGGDIRHLVILRSGSCSEERTGIKQIQPFHFISFSFISENVRMFSDLPCSFLSFVSVCVERCSPCT